MTTDDLDNTTKIHNIAFKITSHEITKKPIFAFFVSILLVLVGLP